MLDKEMTWLIGFAAVYITIESFHGFLMWVMAPKLTFIHSRPLTWNCNGYLIDYLEGKYSFNDVH